MSWILFAFVSPVLLSLTSHLDKYLFDKHFNSGGVGGLTIFSSFVCVLTLPIAWFFSTKNILEISFLPVTILIVMGILSTLAVLSYLLALENEEVTVVVPFFQTIPIFSLILGYLFLGETITKLQIIGMLIIIAGSIVLSLELDEVNNFRFKTKVVLLALMSAFLFTFNGIIFKIITPENFFWNSIFWENVGIILGGLLLFFISNECKKSFRWIMEKNKKTALALNISRGVISLVGNISIEYALLLAPVALVFLADSYEPIFVLAWAIIFYFVFPKIFREKLIRKGMLREAISILIICFGTTLIFIF